MSTHNICFFFWRNRKNIYQKHPLNLELWQFTKLYICGAIFMYFNHAVIYVFQSCCHLCISIMLSFMYFNHLIMQ